MNPSRTAIAHERRRYVQIRKAFETALAAGHSASPDFYLACGDYMLFATDRSHAQGQRIHDRLKARIPAADTTAHSALDEQDDNRQQGRTLMQEFAAALEGLRRDDQSELTTFKTQARKFNEAFNALMAPRKNPFSRYTDELFTEADWVEIAATTDASLTMEIALFTAVCAAAPDNIQPAEMTVEHQ